MGCHRKPIYHSKVGIKDFDGTGRSFTAKWKYLRGFLLRNTRWIFVCTLLTKFGNAWLQRNFPTLAFSDRFPGATKKLKKLRVLYVKFIYRIFFLNLIANTVNVYLKADELIFRGF